MNRNPVALQTEGPSRYYTLNEVYQRLRLWGFDAADTNLNILLPKNRIFRRDVPEILVSGSGLKELFEPWRKASLESGILNAQAHAPYPSWLPLMGKTNAALIEVFKNMLRGCDHIGCRKLIVHPFYAGPSLRLLKPFEHRRNIEAFSKLIPTAKRYGVSICLENMFSRGLTKKLHPACCADPKEAAVYIDELNALAGEETFGFCFDTGHANICKTDVRSALVFLGRRVKALHIHDNDGVRDQHLAPHMGTADWDAFAAALKEIRYSGAVSFETHKLWYVLQRDEADRQMRLLSELGRAFAEGIDA